MGALAHVPGAASVPQHDQSRAGVRRRVALRWRCGRAHAAGGALQGVGLPPGAGAICAGARRGSGAAPSGRIAVGGRANEPLQRVQIDVTVEGRAPLLRQGSKQHTALPGGNSGRQGFFLFFFFQGRSCLTEGSARPQRKACKTSVTAPPPKERARKGVPGTEQRDRTQAETDGHSARNAGVCQATHKPTAQTQVK